MLWSVAAAKQYIMTLSFEMEAPYIMFLTKFAARLL